jgi:uncharacterized protein YbjT (DUF2867 family)
VRILVLGAYGLIGLAIARTLHAAGHSVTGLGRSPTLGPRLAPGIRWVNGDLAHLQSAGDWKPLLENFDVVVNAAGALQDGLRDDLERVHHGAIAALAGACADARVKLIQISAPGAKIDSDTNFMRSKARGDNAIRQSGGDWIILRPGLVIGRDAYGGSAMLRATAASPLAIPLAFGDKRIQSVALSDVAQVVREAAEGAIPNHTDADVLEDSPRSLREIIERLRAWMGIRPTRFFLTVPPWIAHFAARVADALGYLGWRSPLRTTAIRALEGEVLGDAAPLRAIRGASLRSLDQILEDIPASTQERWFSRGYLLMPAMVATLSGFWIVSGAIGLWNVERAAEAIPYDSIPNVPSAFLVVIGAALDLTLGFAILLRPLARMACLGMVALSVVYLATGSVITPGLWLDPLGPFVKVVPAIMLAIATAALLEER